MTTNESCEPCFGQGTPQLLLLVCICNKLWPHHHQQQHSVIILVECLFDKTVTFIKTGTGRQWGSRSGCYCFGLIAKGNSCDKYSFIRIILSECSFCIVSPHWTCLGFGCWNVIVNKWIELKPKKLRVEDISWISNINIIITTQHPTAARITTPTIHRKAYIEEEPQQPG